MINIVTRKKNLIISILLFLTINLIFNNSIENGGDVGVGVGDSGNGVVRGIGRGSIYFCYGKELIQYIKWDSLEQPQEFELQFIIGTTILFSVSNNTGDHNIFFKESPSTFGNIRSPILNYNRNQIYFIYTFIVEGNYLLIDQYSNTKKLKISIIKTSTSTIDSSLFLIQSPKILDHSGNNLDFTKIFKDSGSDHHNNNGKYSEDSSLSMPPKNKSIIQFFSNFTSNNNNSTLSKKKQNIQDNDYSTTTLFNNDDDSDSSFNVYNNDSIGSNSGDQYQTSSGCGSIFVTWFQNSEIFFLYLLLLKIVFIIII